MAYWKDELIELKKKMLEVEVTKSPIQDLNKNKQTKVQSQKPAIPKTIPSAVGTSGVQQKVSVPDPVAKKNPTIVPRSTGIRLNTQAAQFKEINIGFDLGTTYTKIAYRIVGPEIIGFVKLSQGGPEHEKTMIPSVVWIDKDQRLYCSADSRPEGSTPIRFFKMHLAGSGIGACIGNEFCTETPFYQLVTAYFIYRVLRQAKMAIKNDQNTLIGSAQINWSGNLGIPVGYIESKMEDRFLEVLHVGDSLSGKAGISVNQTLQEFDVLYQEALKEAENESINFHLTSELEASISGLTSDITTADGLYGLFDIGGGTLDGAVFSYKRDNGSPRINILTALVAPIGFDVAVDSLASSITREDIQDALKKGSSMLKLKSQDIQKGIHVHVASVVMIARRKSTVRWADTMKTFPVFLCGGGCHSAWLRDTITGTWQSHQHGNCGIPPYQPQSLGVPAEINHGCEYIKDWDRHLVAYGLSFPKGSLSEVVGFPKSNPIMEYGQYNYDSILDERMYEKYGELL